MFQQVSNTTFQKAARVQQGKDVLLISRKNLLDLKKSRRQDGPTSKKINDKSDLSSQGASGEDSEC